MGYLMKVCPNCGNWNSKNEMVCICGTEYVQVHFTDIYWNELSPEQKRKYTEQYVSPSGKYAMRIKNEKTEIELKKEESGDIELERNNEKRVKQINDIPTTAFDDVPIKLETTIKENIIPYYIHTTDLFDDCGSKIKTASIVLFWLAIIGGAVLAFVYGKILHSFILGLVIFAVGAVVAYLSSLILYGFGHIIELLEVMNAKQNKITFTTSGIIGKENKEE